MIFRGDLPCEANRPGRSSFLNRLLKSLQVDQQVAGVRSQQKTSVCTPHPNPNQLPAPQVCPNCQPLEPMPPAPQPDLSSRDTRPQPMSPPQPPPQNPPENPRGFVIFGWLPFVLHNGCGPGDSRSGLFFGPFYGPYPRPNPRPNPRLNPRLNPPQLSEGLEPGRLPGLKNCSGVVVSFQEQVLSRQLIPNPQHHCFQVLCPERRLT